MSDNTFGLCPECQADNEVACPRDIDAICNHCEKGLCAHHILGHLNKKHYVSAEWRGYLKSVSSDKTSKSH